MIKVVAKFVVKQDCLEEFLALAGELVTMSKKEEGNVYYTLNRSTKAENVLAFMECWKDKPSIDKHGASGHFTRIFPQLKPLCEEADPIDAYFEIEF